MEPSKASLQINPDTSGFFLDAREVDWYDDGSMRISLKQLKKLDVETTGGTKLGNISDLVFDLEGQCIVQYKVKGPMLSTKEYLVNRDQVAKITEEAIIVYESVVKQGINEEKKPPPEVQAEPAATTQVS